MKQIQHIISRITLALMRKGCGGGLPKVFQVVLLVTLFSLPNGRAGVGLTFAQELPDDSISTTSVTAVAGNKTYVFKHKATGKWLINNGGTLALSDVQPVSSTMNKYLSEIFQTNGEGIINFALTDINDPNSGVIIDQDTEGGILLAPSRNTEAQSATVYVKGNNGLYLTVYKGKVYGVKNTDSNATQWYAYEVTRADHNFVNSACTRDGCTAHQVSYRKPTYNTNSEGEQDATKGIASWSTQTAVAYAVTSSAECVTWTDGWYYVSGDATLSYGAVCSGNVHLILCDGANLTVTHSDTYSYQAGICVSGDNNSLTIYAQSEGNDMGELKVSGAYYGAGIGGNFASKNGQNITINGGKVTATGGENAAGIGGGYYGNGNYITINGGTVMATGGYKAAGIGGGEFGYGENITINGGTVTATGSSGAAGIGGTIHKDGKNITINGGTVTAIGGTNSNYITSGIGGAADGTASNIYINTALTTMAGSSANPTTMIDNDGSDLASLLAGKQYVTIHKHNIVNGECTFSGCSLKMTYRVPTYNTAGDAKSGIASWSTQKRTEAATQVTSSTSQVTWNAGWYYVSGNVTLTEGAVCNGAVHLILCDGAKLTVTTSNHNQAGICVTGDDNSLTIYAQSESAWEGVLEATGGYDEFSGNSGAGIGGGEGNSGSHITINGGSVTANGNYNAAAIGGSNHGSGSYITINAGYVTANGGDNAAAIGGGAEGEGSDITINGGYVTANGGIEGAGIGGGDGDYGFNIYINGGTVKANGGSCAAGIGGGYQNYGSNIYINGGTVTAIGGDGVSGIGNGENCSYDVSNIYIYINTTLTTLAGTSANPTDEITNDGGDLASSLAGKQYVTVHLHDFTGDNLSTSAEAATGLYACVCDFSDCNAVDPDRMVIKDYAPAATGAAKNLVLTVADGNYSTAEAIALTDANQFKGVTVAFSAPSAPTYTRTMTDEWGTLVVPFAVSAAPEGFEFYGIRSMGDKNELYLRKVTSGIEASTPVFVRRTGSGTSLELTASNETVNTTLATASGTALQGTYASVALNKTDNPNAYFVYNDLLYSTQKLGDANHVTINPFRAYLVTPVVSGAKQLVMVIDEETTTLINNEQLIINNEQLIINNDGKFIENGRVVIVRNGKKYNVNGQVIK